MYVDAFCGCMYCFLAIWPAGGRWLALLAGDCIFVAVDWWGEGFLSDWGIGRIDFNVCERP